MNDTRTANAADRAAIVRHLTGLVAELMPSLGDEPVDEYASLTEAGFDSIATVQLLARAEDDFDVDLAGSDETIRDADSIGSLADCIVRLAGVRR
jgi:acyl carrier protein